MSTSPITIRDSTPATLAGNTPKKSTLKFSSNMTGVGNTPSQAESKDKEEVVASIEKFKDSLDELATAVNRYNRQLRGAHRNDSISTSIDVKDILEDDAHQRVEHIFSILKTKSELSAQTLLQYARKYFLDDSDLVIALRAVLNSRRLSKAERKAIEGALEQIFEEADVKKLKAGINVALKARIYGKKLDLSPAIVRHAYRDFIEGDQPEFDTYQTWVALFGPARRAMVVEFMQTALSADIDSADPSCSDTEFSALLTKILKIKNIRSGDALFLERLLAKKSIKVLNREESDWLFFLFTIMTKPELFKPALYEAGGELNKMDLRAQSEIVSLIHQVIKILPADFFLEDDGSDKIVYEACELIDLLSKKEVSVERTS